MQNKQVDSRQRVAWMREAFDRHGVRRCVIVTGTFRSGTSYICSLLGANGLKGIGKEKLRGFGPCCAPDADKLFRDTLEAALPGNVQNGTLRFKLMWPHRNLFATSLGMGRPRSAEFAALFPDARWINVVRGDIFSRAISFWKAKQTDRWHVLDKSQEPQIEYDFAGIRSALDEQAAHDRLWADFYRVAKVERFNQVYEEFNQDAPRHLQAILDHIGEDHRDEVGPLQVKTGLKKQRNEQNTAFRNRFLRDLYSRGS